MRRVVLLLCLVLAACSSGPKRPKVSGPALSQEPDAHETRMCKKRLDEGGIRFTPVPESRGPKPCSLVGTIRLDDYGIATTGLGPVRCAMAERFIEWTRSPVQQAAAAWLGSPVIAIETMGSYSCRPVNGQSGRRLSEHGVADAIDVSAFRLADGRRITVLQGWTSADQYTRDFLRAVHLSACKRFGVVLGPDANAQHRNHFHLDLAPTRYCR